MFTSEDVMYLYMAIEGITEKVIYTFNSMLVKSSNTAQLLNNDLKITTKKL